MKIKRPPAIVIVAALAFGALGVWCLLPVREPTYQGKPISYWLNLAHTDTSPVSRPELAQPQPSPIFQAKLAVAEIGPEALPFIAKRAGGQSGPAARAYSWLYSKFPSLISRQLPPPKPAPRGLGLILTSGYFLAVTERAGTNAIPTLVRLSTNQNPDVRRAVILSLGRVAALDRTATLPVFDKALHDPERAIQCDALQQLCQMSGTEPCVGPILDAFLEQIGTNLPNEIRFEALAAARVANAKSANPNAPAAQSVEAIWSRALTDLSNWQSQPTPENKQLVLAEFEIVFSTLQSGPSLDRALQRFRFSAEQEKTLLVPLLAKALTARSESVRNGAAHLLQELDTAAQPAVPEIVAALNRPSPPSPSYLINSLAAFGAKSAPAVPTLVELLENEDLAGNALFALSQIGPDASPAVPALLKKSNASTGDDHLACLGALVQIAPQTPALRPKIMALLTAPTPDDRSVGARLLGRMSGATSNELATLEAIMLEDEWLEPRLDAVEALFRLDAVRGPTLVTNVIELIGWTDAEDHVGPARMARLLGEIGQATPLAEAALTDLLAHREEPVRIAAAETLGKLVPKRKPECSIVLRNIMKTSQSGTMRFAAAKTLYRNSPEETGEVVSIVADLLTTNLHFYQQPDAAAFLGEMGPAAESATPQLQSALNSHEWKLRRASFHALERISNKSP